MEFKKFNFEPEDGFLDSSYYEDTPENAREILQRQHNQTRDYINEVTETLNSKKLGESGSESIKSPDIQGVSGDNVYLQLKDIKRQINETALDKIPDGSVTEEKLADESVGTDKIKNKSITKEKFAPDASVPFADDTLNINGIPSYWYIPASKMGSINHFRDLVGVTKITSTVGKTHKGKRYILKDGYLHTLNIETGEFKKAYDVYLEPGAYFTVFGDEDIIVAKYLQDGNIYFYGLDKEYNELYLIKNIKLQLYISSEYTLSGIDSDGENLYFGIYRYYDGEPENTLFKLKLSEIENIDTMEKFDVYEQSRSGEFFCAGNDLIWTNKIYKNGETREDIPFGGVPISYDKEYLLMKDCVYTVINKETMLPCIATDDYLTSDNAFLYNGYMYRQYDDYLFRTKLL